MRCFIPLEDDLPAEAGIDFRLVPYQVGMVCSHQARARTQCTGPTPPSIDSRSPMRAPMRAAVPAASSST